MTTRIATHLSEAQRRTVRAELEREFRRLEATGREGALLAPVVDALARLDDGSFGLCRVCGAPIPWARLSVLPETERCRACSRG